MRPMRRACGFTLVEALVAVTLLALLFGALMPVFQQGLAVLRSGDRHSRAVLLAQSVLDRQLAQGATQAQSSAPRETSRGDFSQWQVEGYRWQVTRAPFKAVQAPLPNEETAPFKLTRISVVVSWPENEFGVQLHTLAIEAAQ